MTARITLFGLAAIVVLCSGRQPATVTWPSGPQTTYATTHLEGNTP